MADLTYGKAKRSLGFPEYGTSPHYLALTLALKMWRRVSNARYTPAYIKKMLAIDKERRKALLNVHIRSIEAEVRPNV